MAHDLRMAGRMRSCRDRHNDLGTTMTEQARTTWLRPAVRERLVTFLLLAVFCVVTAYWQNSQTAALRRSCHTIADGNAAFNKVIDQLARNATASTALTQAQKDQALQTYASIHLAVPHCDGLVP